MQSMEAHEATVGPSDRRTDSGALQTPTGETSCLKAESGSPTSKDPESVETSQIESKNRSTAQKPPARKPIQAARSSNHLRAKTKRAGKPARVDSSSSSSDDDQEESSSDSDSDSCDSEPFSDGEPIRSKKSPRSSKARSHSRKAKAKRMSFSDKSRRRIRSPADSNVDSMTSTDTGGEGRLEDKRAPQCDIYDQIARMELRISQLQLQMAQSVPFPQLGASGLAYGMVPSSTPGFWDKVLPAASNGNVPTLPSSFVTPPQKLAPRLDLGPRATRGHRGGPPPPKLDFNEAETDNGKRKPRGGPGKSKRKGSRVDFKRVDWVWDSAMYTYKLQDTAEMSMSSLYDDYIFHVRRTFDCEGKYRATFVDVKSKLLRECLQDVIGHVRGASLVDETPKLDPNLLFLYLEDLRTHLKHLKKVKPAGDDKKERKRNRICLENKRKQLKVLIKYLDKDFAKIKESLYPMLDSGVITFDLLWALWKPNTLIYGTTYGAVEDPRVFKVDMAYHQSSVIRGDFYFIEGKYLEYDGKKFGYGTVAKEIPDFQGARKITSLPCYPLKYHKEQDQVRKDLIERGKKFVALSGVHYRCYSGIAYMKRKKGSVIKFNVQQSRVMVDPAIFRRINPNYAVSAVRPKDHDTLSDDGTGGDDSDCCACESDGSEEHEGMEYVSKAFKNKKGEIFVASLSKHETEPDADEANLQSLPSKTVDGASSGSSLVGGEVAGTPTETAAEALPDFSEEDYLIASPVVYGFSFSEKQWLELSVSAIKDIAWNEKAWESLVLEPETKDLIQALVQSRKYHPMQTIDDVIQGKGKGLVTVLHGPPGTGKTLTAEGISELLKCPLYMASAGELGTDSRYLEAELQKILDICHAWGAILLLDEADVFLEKRNMQDIHRNALVSIFLRQLEYFQGILFLTTNRVETFDEAFQSRIHIALRYDALDAKAKKTIFKMFIDRIRAFGKLELQTFSEEDLEDLSRHDLNGREIKNVVGSAQDLAVSRKESFSIRHIRQVLDVHAKFGRDLRGGAGYEDAMRSYF